MKRLDTVRVLLVEDEVELAELLRDYLVHEGCEVEMRHSGDGVVEAIRERPPQMVLLDLMLPGVDGLTLCRKVRAFSTVPIIMITARVEEIDRLLGLEIGADDYICKPVRPREVVARVKAVLRRTLPDGFDAQNKALQIDGERYRASVNGQELDLTPLEFRLLHHLARSPGRVYSRDELLGAVHEAGRDVGDRAIDTHIKNLRKKISKHLPEDMNPIQSVYGVGYKLELV
ncbi:response regulator [Gallaecimonas kandeliae]|uniref:response regulator n=1 Tax=Gallaecimonas kandeliae TaxID=3029055 RepID=UPI00264A3C4B|nr:response regulator [Gallaecimonas kandeliae]WKE66340.1 response regulator [Gallaecimonas kandeliae]